MYLATLLDSKALQAKFQDAKALEVILQLDSNVFQNHS